MKNVSVFFLSENFQFLEVKFSVYLNRRFRNGLYYDQYFDVCLFTKVQSNPRSLNSLCRTLLVVMIQSVFRRTAQTLTRLRGCAGWSESSLGAHKCNLVGIAMPWPIIYFSMKICCGYLIEAPLRSPTNEYLNLCFDGENENNIYLDMSCLLSFLNHSERRFFFFAWRFI